MLIFSGYEYLKTSACVLGSSDDISHQFQCSDWQIVKSKRDLVRGKKRTSKRVDDWQVTFFCILTTAGFYLCGT